MPDIIYEDNHLIVVNKPFGMPSQGDNTGDESVFDWVKNYIKVTYQKTGNVYTALLHRLDRPTGGLLVLGKTSKAAARMSKQFQDKKVKKTYWAITERVPQPETQRLQHYLKKLKGKNIMRAYHKNIHGSKEAILTYNVLEIRGKQALVEVDIQTGRRHQIRVQLASIGCTIKGDVKYGKTTFNFDRSIALLAQKISFEHPTLKKQMTFEVQPPDNEVWSWEG